MHVNAMKTIKYAKNMQIRGTNALNTEITKKKLHGFYFFLQLEILLALIMILVLKYIKTV